MWWYALIGVVLGIVVFVWLRATSVQRGARVRDAKILRLLDPIGERLASKGEITAEEIEALAEQAHVRPMLHAVLGEFKRLDLFPERHTTAQSQAEGTLAYWLVHPNELQVPPEEIQFAEKLRRKFGQSEGDFYVFRYKMPAGHWAAKDGWLLGLAGPFREDDARYSIRGAFSRCSDKEGEITPVEVVDWYVGWAQPTS